MPSMKSFFILFIAVLLSTNTQAAVFYRHIPFTISLNDADTVIVNYDFKDKSGINCTSSQSSSRIDFYYKGYFKSLRLPLSLVNDHVPEKKHEALADRQGQFSISPDKSGMAEEQHVIRCDYLGQD
ncbi:hypothetical protein AQUSIP_26270 [Aquicella siphonis]|uniref:Uncharacterized protein n=1 Tax=Aquicella siphonis TaxID=254247 RepID=A0A5E4PJR8_9COXI|nr:hypothetical protein [Aquicella siphonis]VVC77300.1 hypothetical protein AQUSIP_26270 [Aquicella siphonis]